MLAEYERLLKNRKEQFAPAMTDEDWDLRFVEACQTLPTIGYYLDLLYTPDEELRKDTAEALIQDGTIGRLEGILQSEKEGGAEDAEGKDRTAGLVA